MFFEFMSTMSVKVIFVSIFDWLMLGFDLMIPQQKNQNDFLEYFCIRLLYYNFCVDVNYLKVEFRFQTNDKKVVEFTYQALIYSQAVDGLLLCHLGWISGRCMSQCHWVGRTGWSGRS